MKVSDNIYMHLEEYVIRLEKNSVGPFQKCTEKR